MGNFRGNNLQRSNICKMVVSEEEKRSGLEVIRTSHRFLVLHSFQAHGMIASPHSFDRHVARLDHRNVNNKGFRSQSVIYYIPFSPHLVQQQKRVSKRRLQYCLVSLKYDILKKNKKSLNSQKVEKWLPGVGGGEQGEVDERVQTFNYKMSKV